MVSVLGKSSVHNGLPMSISLERRLSSMEKCKTLLFHDQDLKKKRAPALPEVYHGVDAGNVDA